MMLIGSSRMELGIPRPRETRGSAREGRANTSSQRKSREGRDGQTRTVSTCVKPAGWVEEKKIVDDSPRCETAPTVRLRRVQRRLSNSSETPHR